MRNIVAINTSPRKQGTSAMLLGRLKHHLDMRGDRVHILHLYSNLNHLQTIMSAVSTADTIVICGSCYWNTYSADTIKLLEDLSAQPEILQGKNLYGIIQGGMPYTHTHVSGLNMLKMFSNKSGVTYQGGFVMGLGAMLDGQSLSKLPNGKKVERQLLIFFEHIHNGEKSPDSVYEKALLKIPGFALRIIAALGNRQINKALNAQGIDVRQPSPYLDDHIGP